MPVSLVSARVGLAAASLAVLAVVALPHPAGACSICRCGDPTFNALGKDGFAARGLRVAVDWERFDKTEGNPAEESESQVEHRITALASYGLGERLTVFARVPFSVRDLTASAAGQEPESIHTKGVSDPELYAQLELWSSPFRNSLGRRASLSVLAGVKTPWGQNEAMADGERLDEHAQPGTGSTDVFGTLAFLYLFDKDSALFASTSVRRTGENDYGYRYGRTVMANLAYEHKLGPVLDGVAELNFRHAGRDRIDGEGTLDEDTGGSLLYVTPRLLASLGHGLVLRAAVQIPVARRLNGYQKERAVANVGLTYLFTKM
jgi:hypothetical protein